MSFFSDIKNSIDDGLNGRNKGYSLGMPRLDKHVSLRQKMFYMIMGSTGSGKSSLLYNCFILNPLELNALNPEGKTLKYILFSMERSKSYILAKWLIRRVFLDTGILIPMYTLLNWYGDKLTSEALAIIDKYESYFDFLESRIDIYEGSRSANDIFRIVMEDAEKDGKVVPINEYKKEYIPNDKDVDKVVALDHFGIGKTTKEYPTKKQTIDRTIEHIQYFRDFLGRSIIGVNQLNRDLSSPIYSKLDSFEPHLDNAKETGTSVEAADFVMSVFDPLRYNTNDKYYGDVSRFKSPIDGHKYFRNLKVLKNSYGIDDAAIGTVFQGETGIFRELPKSSIIRDGWNQCNFDSIFNNSYFLQDV